MIPAGVAGIIHFSEVEVFTSVEVYQRTLVEVLISGLHQIGLRLQISILRLIELRDGRLACLVFGLHQLKGVLRTLHGLQRCLFLRLRIQGVVIHLLDLLIERLLGVVECQLLILIVDARTSDIITCLEAVEDRDVQIQADILREVVFQLFAKGVRLKARRSIIVRAKASAEGECRIVGSLGNLDAVLVALQLQLLGENLGLDAQGLSVNLIGGETKYSGDSG